VSGQRSICSFTAFGSFWLALNNSEQFPAEFSKSDKLFDYKPSCAEKKKEYENY
jgi:hypothetical protein